MGKDIGHGFEPSVCEGCPEHTYFDGDGGEKGVIERAADLITKSDGYWGCGLCGCPTGENLLLDQLQAVPEDCPRKAAHKRESDDGSDGGFLPDGGQEVDESPREKARSPLDEGVPDFDVDISDEKLEQVVNGLYRDGGLTPREAAAAYKVTDMSVSRAAETCGLGFNDMLRVLELYDIDIRYGPDAPGELDENER